MVNSIGRFLLGVSAGVTPGGVGAGTTNKGISAMAQSTHSLAVCMALTLVVGASAFAPALRSPLLGSSRSGSLQRFPLASPVSPRVSRGLLSLHASTTESSTPLPAPPAPGQLNAPELIKWLWNEAQFRDDYPACSMEFFADDVVYEDMVYAEPFVGKEAVRDMLVKTKELAPPDFVFVLDRVGDGAKCCGFTWHIELSTRPDAGKFANGMSMYELNDEGKICYVRDLVEPFPKTGDFGLKLANFFGKLLKLTPPPDNK